MIAESKRATAAAVAQSESPIRLYHRVSQQASRINEILAAPIFSLHSPHVTVTEGTTILDVLDDLIHLKIDAGFLVEGQPS